MKEMNLRPWQLLEEKSELLKVSTSSLSKLSTKLEKVCSAGSLTEVSALEVQIEEKISQIQDLKSTIVELADEIQKSATNLQSEVESLCRSMQISKHIFSTGPNLVVFPLVLRFDNSGGSNILIGSEKFQSFRPDSIVEKIRSAISQKFESKVFHKSLYSAYSMLLKNENQKDVSLEDIRQLLAISHDSTSRMTKDQFAYLLQLFAASQRTTKDLPLAQLIPVAAAKTRYLLFDSDGTSISVGAISFDHHRKK